MVGVVNYYTLQSKIFKKLFPPGVHIWGVSEYTRLQNENIRPWLMLDGDAKAEYNRLVLSGDISYNTFRQYVAPKYINQIIHDPDAMRDLSEIVACARQPGLELILAGRNSHACICVRSIIIGLLEGAELITNCDYATDVEDPFDPNFSEYREYYEMVPMHFRHKFESLKQ